jgi:methionyl-tRNA formyltransferase
VRVVFFGSPSEVIAPLAHLFDLSKKTSRDVELVAVVSQPSKPVGRGGQISDPPVASWAKEHNIACLQPDSAKDAGFLGALKELNADVFVTAAYGQILSDALLAIPKRATINIHPSKLPLYRGATPVPAALLDRLSKTAVTILFTVKKLDAGPLILSKDFDIHADESAGELTLRLFSESSLLLEDALSKLKDPTFAGVPQDDTQASYCKKIEKDDGLVAWDQSADHIYSRFRAFLPWPGSWTVLSDRRVVIVKMRLTQESSVLPSGSVEWNKSTKSLYVHTKDRIIAIEQLKPAGGKIMDAASFWNGLRDKSNVRFEVGDSL